VRKTKVDLGQTPIIRAQRKLRQVAKYGLSLPIKHDEAVALLALINSRKVELITRRDEFRKFARELGATVEFWAPEHIDSGVVGRFASALKDVVGGKNAFYTASWAQVYQEYMAFINEQTETLFEMMRDGGGSDGRVG